MYLQIKIRNKNLGRNSNTILKSSFGRYGYNRIERDKNEIINGLFIKGYSLFPAFILSQIERELKRIGISYTRIPSPFSDDILEEITVGDDFIISSKEEFPNFIDAMSFFNNKVLIKEKDALARYQKMHDELIEYSREEFALASKAHFKLEDIYKAAMSFSKNEEIADAVILKTIKILTK